MKKIRGPLISICIPSYNYGNYLPEAIISCLSIDHNFELVILDNGSTDNTPLLKSRYESDPRIKWYRNDTVLQIQDNWNKAVSLTTGMYVKLLQADDILHPGFFDLFQRAVEKYPEAGIFGHLAIVIDQNGQEIRRQQPYGKDQEYFSVSGVTAFRLKLNNIARFKEPSCNFFLKECWEKIGGYRSDMRFTFDIAFNVAMASQFGGVLINDFGASIRRHQKSDGATLPSSLAVSDLNKFTSEIITSLGASLTKHDRIAANSIMQYRIIEIFSQRVKYKFRDSLKFLWSHKHFFNKFSSFPTTARTILRKIKTGDIQDYIK